MVLQLVVLYLVGIGFMKCCSKLVGYGCTIMWSGVMLEWCGIPGMYVVGMYCDLVTMWCGCCCD